MPSPLASVRALLSDSAGRAILVAFLANSVVFGSWVSRIPAIQVQAGLGEGALGLALLGLPLGAITAAVLAGRLVDLRGPGFFLIVGGVAAGVLAAGSALATSAAGLFAGVFAFGLANGATGVAMNVGAVVVEARLGRRVISACHGTFSVGAALGAAVGAGAAGAGLSPTVHMSAVAVVVAVAVVAARQGASELPAAGGGARPPVIALPRPPLVLLAVVAACVHAGESAMADWSAVYLTRGLGTSAAFAGLGYATFSIAMAAGRLFGDPVADRLGATALVRWGSALACLGLAVAVLSGQPGVALAGFACAGLGLSGAFPALLRAAGGARGVSAAVGVASVSGAAFVGGVMQPPLVGAVAEAQGLGWALGLIAALAALAAVLAPAAFRRLGSEG